MYVRLYKVWHILANIGTSNDLAPSHCHYLYQWWFVLNGNLKNQSKTWITRQENLRDWVAATSLVILLKLDSNHWIFVCMTFKFNGWPWKTIGHLFYAMWSFVHYFKAISEFNLSENQQLRSKLAVIFPMWPSMAWSAMSKACIHY